jgi:hypothetical protein
VSEYGSAGDIRAELTAAGALLRERTIGQSRPLVAATSASEEWA